MISFGFPLIFSRFVTNSYDAGSHYYRFYPYCFGHGMVHIAHLDVSRTIVNLKAFVHI